MLATAGISGAFSAISTAAYGAAKGWSLRRIANTAAFSFAAGFLMGALAYGTAWGIWAAGTLASSPFAATAPSAAWQATGIIYSPAALGLSVKAVVDAFKYGDTIDKVFSVIGVLLALYGYSAPRYFAFLGKGRLIGSKVGLEPHEKFYVDEMLEQGNDVQIVPRSDIDGVRTNDFLINDTNVELKSIFNIAPQNQTPDRLSSKVADRIMSGRGQSDNIIADARKQAGMTKEIAERAIRRAYGIDNRDKRSIKSITVIGKDFSITRRREE